ncbi:MAG: glycosyltransferase family 2 protein [Acidimicrobiales bacterium]|nr:glycosyltransferase family 2 protein [Acidimicrobiales bacterium]
MIDADPTSGAPDATPASTPPVERRTVLSVIMPVFNEQATLEQIVDRVLSLDLPVDIELLAVDDGSADRSVEILRGVEDPRLRVAVHQQNKGKGAAIRTGLNAANGDIVVVQDADLEYDPAQWSELLVPILNRDADVVYGSRFLGDASGMRWQNRWANKGLTAMTRILFGTGITDMETCYKMLRLDMLAGISLEANRFDIEPEITARLLRRGVTIHEIPIAYEARSHDDGKKIGWRDGVAAVKTLVKWRLRRAV